MYNAMCESLYPNISIEDLLFVFRLCLLTIFLIIFLKQKFRYGIVENVTTLLYILLTLHSRCFIALDNHANLFTILSASCQCDGVYQMLKLTKVYVWVYFLRMLHVASRVNFERQTLFRSLLSTLKEHLKCWSNDTKFQDNTKHPGQKLQRCQTNRRKTRNLASRTELNITDEISLNRRLKRFIFMRDNRHAVAARYTSCYLISDTHQNKKGCFKMFEYWLFCSYYVSLLRTIGDRKCFFRCTKSFIGYTS